eukprot:8694446-Alexandrium_andersonii.AAC.1
MGHAHQLELAAQLEHGHRRRHPDLVRPLAVGLGVKREVARVEEVVCQQGPRQPGSLAEHPLSC